MLHLHMGLKPAELSPFFRALSNTKCKYTVDGDGWNVWGEGCGINGNDLDTLHVIVQVRDQDEAAEVLSLDPNLVPNKDGLTAVLTESDEWSVIYQMFPDMSQGISNETLMSLVLLRTYALSMAYELAGSSATAVEREVKPAYEALLHELLLLHQDRA